MMMMIPFCDVFLLAVLASADIAHASVLVPSQQEVAFAVTSSLTHVNETRGVRRDDKPSSGNLLSLEGDTVAGRGTASVVQDWSLRCQQLCGAGLGTKLGAPHYPAVDESESLQLIGADSDLNLFRDKICKNLCRLQLGGVACRCRPAASHSADCKVSITPAAAALAAHRNAACGTFCTHTDEAPPITCTLCSLKRTEAADGVDDDASTTPDWNALCASLCRTGDGGSLCNCDLPPFFRKV